MEYIYGNPGIEWKQVASIFAAHDSVHSEQTSSLPLVQFWQPKESELSQEAQVLIRDCGLEPSVLDSAQFCFEYPVSVQCGGRGKASMTDLMIITDNYAIALEAKWKECGNAYPPISKWLETNNADIRNNREKVLEGWIKYINDYLDNSINEQIDKSKIPYQMLHRIASACAVANKCNKAKAIVIYQLFYNGQTKGGTKASMLKFCEKLKAGYNELFSCKKLSKISFCIIQTEVVCENFEAFKEKCPKGKDKNGKDKYYWNALFRLMQKNPIYTFPEPSIKLFPLDPK